MKVLKKSAFKTLNVGDDGTFVMADFPRFLQYLTNMDSDLGRVFDALQNSLRFGDNFLCQEKTVADTGSANTEFSVSHTLSYEGRAIIPTRFLVTYTNGKGVIYDSGTTWTTSTVYLKCSDAHCSVKILLLP